MKAPHFLYRACISLSLMSCIGLSGCASGLHAVVSPAFGSAIESAGEAKAFNNATPATYGISPDLYRDYNCQQLALFKASSEKERSKPGTDRMVVQLYGFEIDAYAQVEREKGCLTIAPSGTKAAPIVATPAVASGSPKIAAVPPTTASMRGIGALTETDVSNLAYFRASDCKGLVDARQRQAQQAREVDVQLAANAAEMRKQSKRDRYLEIQRETAAMFERNLVLLEMVSREKNCDGTASSVAATAGDKNGQLANGGKVSTGRIGITIADVQAHIAEGFGLDRPRGALVISVVDGGPAKQAGLKPLDIILSVNGRVIERSSELQANLHSGTEATLQVWRDRAARPLKVKVVTITGPGPGEVVVAQSMPSPPAARVTDAPPRPYCFATLEDLGKVSGVMSGVWERPTSFNTRGGFAAGVDRFVREMRQLQPGVWNDDFAAAKCWENVDTMCDTNSLRHLFGSSQVAIMHCSPTRDQALAVQNSLRQAKQPLVYQTVDYSAGSID